MDKENEKSDFKSFIACDLVDLSSDSHIHHTVCPDCLYLIIELEWKQILNIFLKKK